MHIGEHFFFGGPDFVAGLDGDIPTAGRKVRLDKEGFALCARILLGWVGLLVGGSLQAHQETAPTTSADIALADASRKVAAPAEAVADSCRLRLRLEDATTHQPVDGLVRVTPLEGGAPLALEGFFERPAGWFSVPSAAELKVPPGRIRVEATRGIDTAIVTAVADCAPDASPVLPFAFQRFYDASARHLRSANTHLHLLKHLPLKMGVDLQSRQNADDYLRTVGASDGLDLVYVSYLTQLAMEVISNEYTDEDFKHLSSGPTVFAGGVEHRHGSVRVKALPAPAPVANDSKTYVDDSSVAAMTYGHVMLLNLARRSMLASIGPGFAPVGTPTDGVPLRDGIVETRRQGGTAIWCHGTFGLEDTPDWVAGLMHAQNIYDGGNEGTFDTVYYPYLNAGLKVPFSTGTDWGIWDFSRVYVTAPAEFSSKIFLEQLTAGRSYITNEPFLEFKVGEATAGDTITLARPGPVLVRGRAVGRSDFVRLQLVQNGRVVREVASRAVAGHFEADLTAEVNVGESGWLALRIPPVQPYEIRSRYSGPGTNIFGKAIFAHTSPVYLSVGGRPVFDRAALEELIGRIDAAVKIIEEKGSFANEAERDGIRRIYAEAKTSLQATLAKNGER